MEIEDIGDEVDGEYVSEELYSSNDSESDPKRGPRYSMFKKEELVKDYKFKEAMLEYYVLIGRQVTFKKNDLTRVLAVCKEKCGYKALVSRVGESHTYRMKTYVGVHTRTKVFNNKCAKTKWVAKQATDLMEERDNFKLFEIVTTVRKRYSTGTFISRAFQAKKLEMKMVEGEATKQYTLLWRYSVELRRVSIGDICKIELRRYCPILQPRFGSFYFAFDGCKKGFISGCQPFIGVDDCHLKTRHGGQLLVAIGRDPNDQYFPLAFVVVETETKESWKWFLQLLLEDIGQDKK